MSCMNYAEKISAYRLNIHNENQSRDADSSRDLSKVTWCWLALLLFHAILRVVSSVSDTATYKLCKIMQNYANLCKFSEIEVNQWLAEK